MPERDERGRFAQGNTISREGAKKGGRPRRAIEERYLHALVAELPLEEWREMVRAARQRARKDQATFADLANRLIGKPSEYQNLDVTSDGERFGSHLADGELLAELVGLLEAARTRAARGADPGGATPLEPSCAS